MPVYDLALGDDFARGQQVKYVLGKWSETELIDLISRKELAVDITKAFGTTGLQRTMESVQTTNNRLCLTKYALTSGCGLSEYSRPEQ